MAEKNALQDIERLKKQIENQLHWGKADAWHSTMFNELSEKIFESIKIKLSVATLKRFFGVVDHSGSPSTTTLDALSQFVGEENWRAFKFKQQKKHLPIFSVNWKAVYLGIGFLTAIVIVSLISNKRPALIINKSEFDFSSSVLSDSYPNSVLFKFKIPNQAGGKNFQIQQYWDKSKTITIRKEQTQATGIYYFPGHFNAKLIVDGQVASEHSLFLKSEGWLGTIEYKPVPKYFKPLIDSSGIALPALLHDELSSSEDPLLSVFHYISDLGNISGDDFSFTGTVQSKFGEKWAICRTLNIYFIGTEGAMIIPFSKLGCSSDNNLMLNDIYLSGKENDLSAFSADLSNPTSLGIEVKDKNATVSINNEKVYSKTYSKTMGKLVGIRFKFLGVGEVINYHIKDQNGNKITL